MEKAKMAKRTKIYFALAAVLLVVAIAVSALGSIYKTVLTVALEGSPIDEELAKESYAAGIEMNLELETEGAVLLKNENGQLPMAAGKINLFGEKAVNTVFNASGSAASGSTDSVSIKDGLEHAGFTVNPDLIAMIEKLEPETDTAVHEGNSVDISKYPITEPKLEDYTGNISFDNLKAYSDQAVVVIGRLGGEGQDLPRTGFGDDETKHYLELSDDEINLLHALKDNGFNTTVLINSSYAMELGFLELEEYGVNAALWIGGPGQAGADSVAKLLTGESVPSGRLTDTYAYDLTTQSSFYTGDYYYYYGPDNADKTIAGYSNYAEGIYVGYRWYETADEEDYWDDIENEFGKGYEGVVQYPFGYGLSYTTFEQKIESAEDKGETIELQVKVENTGDTYSGKDVIEIFAEAPYTNGGIEKSKVVLVGFEKTPVLAPGEETTCTVTVNKENLASYDASADGGNGAYVLEDGKYYLYLSENAHSWDDINKRDDDKCYKLKIKGEQARYSDQVAAANLFPNAAGDMQTLSRKDGFANAAETIGDVYGDITLSADDELLNLLEDGSKEWDEYNGELLSTDLGKKNRIKLEDMTGAEYDDERWNDFIDQLTAEEMINLIGTGGWSTAEVKSISKAKTTDIDGPFGLSNYVKNELGNNTSLCVSYCSEPVVAATWNRELIERFGETVGQEANATAVSGWYAPGANLHRSSFSGRNPEYYSEDAYISGEMCSATAKGALSKGLYVYLKHFAFNDQEANRTNKENCWMTEQTARELYLKAFETPVKEAHATGLMASYMWFEGEWAGGNQALMSNLIRDEWGFKGMVITDNYCGAWMNATKSIMAGTELILSNKLR